MKPFLRPMTREAKKHMDKVDGVLDKNKYATLIVSLILVCVIYLIGYVLYQVLR